MDPIIPVQENELSNDASPLLLVQALESKLKRKISQATRAQIVELYESGETNFNITAKLKLPRSSVEDVIRRLKDKGREFAINPKWKPIVFHSPQIKARIVEMHSQGSSIVNIATTLKISYSSVLNVVKKLNAFGVTAALSNTKKRRTQQEKDHIIKMFGQGSSLNVISSALKIPVSTVRSLLKRVNDREIIAAPRKIYSPEIREKVVQLHLDNLSIKSIGLQTK